MPKFSQAFFSFFYFRGRSSKGAPAPERLNGTALRTGDTADTKPVVAVVVVRTRVEVGRIPVRVVRVAVRVRRRTPQVAVVAGIVQGTTIDVASAKD